MNWSGKRVLVTGAAGFIGSHLIEELVRKGARTRALIHYNSLSYKGWLDQIPAIEDDVEFATGDIRDFETVRNAVKQQQIVFHLAALIGIPYSYESQTSYVRTNVEGSLNIFQASLEADIELLIQTSSSEVYGTAQYVPINEEHPLSSQSPYAATKIAADQLGLSFCRSFGLPLKLARPFNTYGPRQSARAIIPTIITQALNSGDEIVVGNLNPTRDFTFVEDTVAGLLTMAETEHFLGEVVNIGSNTEISIAELARLILQIVGCNRKVAAESQRQRPTASEVERLVCDNTKLVSRTSWRPQWNLSEGLEKTVEWFRDNLHKYNANTYYV